MPFAAPDELRLPSIAPINDVEAMPMFASSGLDVSLACEELGKAAAASGAMDFKENSLRVNDRITFKAYRTATWSSHIGNNVE